MKMRREARVLKHDTTGVQKNAVRTEDWWVYRPDQHVRTVDGVGRVIAVHDGPFPGAEEYEIALDGGIGGGRYDTRQILGVVTRTEASTDHLASDDYEELGDLLFTRPDPASLTYTASLGPDFAAEDGTDDLVRDAVIRSEATLFPPSSSTSVADGTDLLRSELESTASTEASVVRSNATSTLFSVAHVVPDRPQYQVCHEVHAGVDIARMAHVHRAGISDEMPIGPTMSLHHAWVEGCGVGTVPEIAVTQASRGSRPEPAICIACAVNLAPETVLDRLPGATASDLLSATDHVCSLASHWYPELGTLLLDRPDPATMQYTASLRAEATADSDDFEHPDKVYLRFGQWPEDERSHNNVTGEREFGVSTYELDHRGEPKDPDPGFDRGHTHDSHCEPDCDLDWDNDDYGNDTKEEMDGRVSRAEGNRRNGRDLAGETGHLVKGTFVGLGHDAEPLLNNVRRVGDWIDHRHHFFPMAEPHRLARDLKDEDYEEPEEQPTHHTALKVTAESTDQVVNAGRVPQKEIIADHMRHDHGVPWHMLDDETDDDLLHEHNEEHREHPISIGHHHGEIESGEHWCDAHQEYHDDPQEAEDHVHDGGSTDWSAHLWDIPDEIHRGMNVKLPKDVHDFVHDEDRPEHERAEKLLHHLKGGMGSGMHWSTDEDAAKGFAEPTYDNDGSTRVVMSAETPHPDDFETDPSKLDGAFHFSHEESEVPLKRGTPLKLNSIQWNHRPEIDINARSKYSPPDASKHANEWYHPYTHHDFETPHTLPAQEPLFHATAAQVQDPAESLPDEDQGGVVYHSGHGDTLPSSVTIGVRVSSLPTLSHLTLGPDPKDELGAAEHLIEHHGFTFDQLNNLEDPGQGDPFTAQHSLEHDLDFEQPSGGSFGGGEEGGSEHVHNPYAEPRGLKDFPQVPTDYHPGWGGAHNPRGDMAKTEPAEADPDIPLHSLSSLPSIRAHDWVGFPDEDDEARKHLHTYHGVDPDYIYAPHEQHDRAHEEIDEAEYHDSDLHGVPHEHRTVDREWSPRPWEGKERSGGSTYDDADRRALAPINTGDFSPVTHSLSMLVTAAIDPGFRFHVTASWRDVQAKAKRIRARGGVQITHSDSATVFGNVRGDHNVYETGLQRVVGKRQSVATYTCGCKWGAYHWGASDDLSRFAGRMCSHALALQYEAASRGMFGKDVRVDDHRPRWVPSKVVVKYDIDNGQHIRATSSVPEQSPLLVMLGCAADDDPGLQVVTAAVNDLFGDTAGAVEPSLMNPSGPTEPRNPEENPTSAGTLTASEPDNWGRINAPTMFPRFSSVMSTEAFWQALIPVVRAVAPAILSGIAGDHKDSDGAEATLHDEPEGALPETDGSEHQASVGDLELADHPSVTSLSLEDDALSPSSESIQTHGSVTDIVAEFQQSDAAKALMSSTASNSRDGMDISAAAEAFLTKTAITFSSAERYDLIEESPGVQAGNTDRLDIAGTHYAELESLDGSKEGDDFSWLM